MNLRGFLMVLNKFQGGGDAVAATGGADEDKAAGILPLFNLS